MNALIYFVRCNDGYVKIGYTIRVASRRKQLKRLEPEFLFGFYVDADLGHSIELAFHRHFEGKRVYQRPIEQFRLTDADLLEARSLVLVRAAGSVPFCECHGLTKYRRRKGWETAPRQRVLMMRVTPKPNAKQWERMPSFASLSVQ
jgi:hypothetical protein